MRNVKVINSNKCESPAQSPVLNTIKMFLADLKAFVRSKYCPLLISSVYSGVLRVCAFNLVR